MILILSLCLICLTLVLQGVELRRVNRRLALAERAVQYAEARMSYRASEVESRLDAVRSIALRRTIQAPSRDPFDAFRPFMEFPDADYEFTRTVH